MRNVQKRKPIETPRGHDLRHSNELSSLLRTQFNNTDNQIDSLKESMEKLDPEEQLEDFVELFRSVTFAVPGMDQVRDSDLKAVRLLFAM